MSAKLGLLIVVTAVVLLPWLVWRWPVVRRFAPLAVVQIMIGVALGPSLLGRVAPDWHAAVFSRPVLAALDGLSGLGVLLYVFVTGLHVDLMQLRADAGRVAGIALGSVLLPLVAGLAAAWGLASFAAAGQGGWFSVSLAICIAVTALPVLAAVLQETGLLHTRLGQTGLAAAALNDLALWLMLAGLLAAAGRHGAGGWLVLLGGASWLVLLWGARQVLAWLARDEHAVLAVGVAFAAASAALSEACGTGYLIGAFAAGLAVPVACRAALLARLEMVTATVLLPFFFMATGLQALIEPAAPGFLAVFVVATLTTIAAKVAGAALPARLAGYAWPDALALGVMMQTKGLMEVVVLSVLHGAGLIGTEAFSALVAMAVVCTLATAPLLRLAQRFRVPRAERQAFLA